MILKIRKPSDLPYSAITPEPVYRSRRDFCRTVVAGAAAVVAGSWAGGADVLEAQTPLAATRNPKYVAPDKPNTLYEISHYNNFYEFGVNKTDPAKYAGQMKVQPWTVTVDGLVNRPGHFGVEDLVDFKSLEERVYRHRCVEGWSMVMPWIGVPLASVLKKIDPAPSAAFVEFTTLMRPSEMPGERTSVLPWPYVEGLRMDEAMHPLTLMVVGLYGAVLPNADGAPLRVHVPWKYGFKSGKSIVRIRLTDKQPRNTWAVATPNEYGFYANVNPAVDHPRWSQAREVRLPGLFKNRPTQMFNGYADEVASLYAGMDLKKNF